MVSLYFTTFSLKIQLPIAYNFKTPYTISDVWGSLCNQSCITYT